MIIDNRQRHGSQGALTVWEYINYHASLDSGQQGALDLVTGYFTIRALAHLHDHIPASTPFRIVSSEMVTREEDTAAHVIDLLSGDLSVDAALELSEQAKKAKAFLQRDNVDVRAVLSAFCHAKLYLFANADRHGLSFYLSGSSNLTEAGLGLQKSSNVELNIARSVATADDDFIALKSWFEGVWKDAARQIDDVRSGVKGRKISIKEYFIRKIDEYFKEYTPEQIYYKILFELFRQDLETDTSPEHTRDMTLLQNTQIWNTLFAYQQQGVISLIKMLRRWGGAILADAVGLGKTFSALAVIKYFATQGYTPIVFCPKKLQENWYQYLEHNGSRFEDDRFNYLVRFHTDLQDDRLQLRYTQGPLSWLKTCSKLLIVIDESHNLRNEKSQRYKTLVDELLKADDQLPGRDVKTLLLSATPINTGLRDVRGQFNLIARGEDNAFSDPEMGVASLQQTFAESERHFREWAKDANRTVGGLIRQLPEHFFSLTDKLIVARTRKLIEKTLGEDLGFPQKEKPINIYQGVDHFGPFVSTDAIYAAFDKLSLTAYRPSLFIPASRREANKGEKEWGNEVARERYLVRMMGILFMKRLESSWHACLLTVAKVLSTHQQALDLVVAYQQHRDAQAAIDIDIDTEQDEEMENDDAFTLRRGTVRLADMQNLGGFEKGLRHDVNLLTTIHKGLLDFQQKFEKGEEKDPKLEQLIAILHKKSKAANKKVVIFTAYTDTALFLYDQLLQRGFSRMACVAGTTLRTTGQHPATSSFLPILQRFAPYSKLYKERDWSTLYRQAQADGQHPDIHYDSTARRWQVTYDHWQQAVRQYDHATQALLDDPIDILIATDCLSEGQNLQDADLQINYDIHWNPVRLIQRFGRIDRIGSPNQSVQCVNFWPTDNFNNYLKLQERVKNRMVIMNVAGTETLAIDEQMQRMEADNPLELKNEERILRMLSENSLADIEQPQTLALSDLSLETFRQDLLDYLNRNKQEFESMPPGIFSGFQHHDNLFLHIPESLVAVIGYPHREPASHTPYQRIYLMLAPVNAADQPQFAEMNKADILAFLRANKNEQRFVPQWIEQPSANDAAARLSRLSQMVQQWMEAQVKPQAQNALDALFSGKPVTTTPQDKAVEDVFHKENFDLIVWEYISK